MLQIIWEFRMEKGYVENGFIIDLSNAKNTTQRVFELS